MLFRSYRDDSWLHIGPEEDQLGEDFAGSHVSPWTQASLSNNFNPQNAVDKLKASTNSEFPEKFMKMVPAAPTDADSQSSELLD